MTSKQVLKTLAKNLKVFAIDYFYTDTAIFLNFKDLFKAN